jgi:Cys-tRNA(Pro) deacylase
VAVDKHPVTQAVRALRAAKVAYEGHLYEYVERGGTESSAAALGVDEHIVIKTIVLEDERAKPLVALMHGDASVSTKALARHLNVKLVRPCDPAVAERHTGYKVGGLHPSGSSGRCPSSPRERARAAAAVHQRRGAWLPGGHHRRGHRAGAAAHRGGLRRGLTFSRAAA